MKMSDMFDSEAKRVAFIKRCTDSVRRTGTEKDSMCGVIRDLIPLYLDDALSEGSRALIDDHLRECESCRRFLDVSRRVRKSASERVPHRPQGYAALADRLKKRRAAYTAAGAAIIGLTLAYGVYTAFSSRRESVNPDKKSG